MEEYEDILIDRCVRSKYDFLEGYEKERVAALAKEAGQKGDALFPSYDERKALVKSEIRKYFTESDKIVPGGFVDFRLRQMYDMADAMTDKGADIFFKEKEYEEFTNLLSIFITEKESREEVLHVVRRNDKITLLNKRGRDVTEKYEKEFYSAAKEKGIGKEDIAISAVISAAPKRLIVHLSGEESPLKEALAKIFAGRCKICPGCNICKND